MLVLKFKHGDYVRVPIYLKSETSLFATTPEVVDFGLIQLNQQPLVIPIKATFSIKNIRRVVDYILPVDEPNLDFRMLDPVDI